MCELINKNVFETFGIKGPVVFGGVTIENIEFTYDSTHECPIGALVIYCDVEAIKDEEQFEEDLDDFFRSRGLCTYNMRYDDDYEDDISVSFVVCKFFISDWCAKF